jgi:hypothetical protein
MPQKPSGQSSLQLGIPQTAKRTVVQNRLHFHGYKVQTVQVLKLEDKLHRFQFAKDILPNVEADKNYFRSWIFTDQGPS